MAYITLRVEDNQLIHFAHFNDGFEVWQTLSKKYEYSTFSSRLYLRRKLYGIHYRSGPMSEHIDSIMEVVSLLRGSGKPLEDEEIVAILLVSLPEPYSGLVTALEGKQEADLTIDQRRIENEESEEKSTEVALQSAAVVSKGSNNNNSTISKNDKGKRKNYKKDNKNIRVCFFCSKPGHVKADCYSYKR